MTLYMDVHTIEGGVSAADAASTVRKEAHGLGADDILQVKEGV